MKRRLNVLSIDWDYFIDADAGQRMELFPDGGNENLPPSICASVWASHYLDDRLANIKTSSKELRHVKKALCRTIECGELEEFMITDSHRFAYDFVLDHFDKDVFSGVNLVNIDYHHDVYNNGEKVDCGNWLERLIHKLEGTDSSYTWVSRPDSDVNIFSSTTRVEEYLNMTTDIDIVDEYGWDIVFICRSGMWSPPHLDGNFKRAFCWLISDGYCGRYQNGISKSRYPDVKKIVEVIRRSNEEVKALYSEKTVSDDL